MTEITIKDSFEEVFELSQRYPDIFPPFVKIGDEIYLMVSVAGKKIYIETCDE